VLGVKKGFRFHEWNNRINRLSYDFVVCAKDSSLIAAIELDDESHETPLRKDTDAKKTKATNDAGIRLIRWHVKDLPEESTIQRELGGIHSSTGLAFPNISLEPRRRK
jgi:very-short-patch-repair endonuclease